MRALITDAHFELIPTPKVALQFPHLPVGSTVSVTCSPVQEIEATLSLSKALIDLGHSVIPHLAARMVAGPDHVAAIAAWLREHNQQRVFIIGGDAPDPKGPYLDAAAFLAELVAKETPLTQIGIGGYPDGHSQIPHHLLTSALLDKQRILDDVGISGWISTQMCFDAGKVSRWIEEINSDGVHLPIHLGVPGVVDTTKLLTMGTRLGVGASLRYLRKNRAVVSKLVSLGGYDPLEFLDEISPMLADLGVEALHMFTFNQVANTAAWRQGYLANSALN